MYFFEAIVPGVNILHKKGKLFPNANFQKHKLFPEFNAEVKFPEDLFFYIFSK